MARLTFTYLVALAATFAKVSAAPMPGSHHQDDSAIGEEVAVSAPNGIPISDTAELASQIGTPHYSTPPPVYTPTTTTVLVEATQHVTATNIYAPHVTTPAMHDTTTAAAHPITTQAPHATTTAYGSGSTYWGGDGYDSCVQQCLATYSSPPPAVHNPTPTHGGAAATHTIIVAPTQGVLRMVPFAVNASVGDTVKFVWGAGPHTVTKSSALQVCNASLADGAFDSGRQNASFVWEQIVNTTEPTFYYCAVGVHCSRGMFGVINPATTAPSANASVASWMAAAAQTNPDVAAMWSYTNQKTAGTSAEQWGYNIDMTGMPEDAYSAVAENVMYGQLFYSANPGSLESGNGASVENGSSGLSIPVDITTALAAQPSAPTTATGPAATSTAGATSGSSNTGGEPNTPAPASNSGSSRSVMASSAVVGLVALLVSFAAL